MLTDNFRFLLPRHIEPDLAAKLRALADDLERIASGTAPTIGRQYSFYLDKKFLLRQKDFTILLKGPIDPDA
jgi:hypothetical protein